MCLKVATLNCYRQSGFGSAKQISNFISQHKLDVVHFQEINLDEDSFGESSISSLFDIYPNNSVTGYGTGTIVGNHIKVDKLVNDTEGRV